MDCLKPNLTILCKLGSLLVHIDEMMSDNGHEFDATAIRSLLDDPELEDWRKAMDKLGLLPVMR